jgi:hypothetical protein
MPEPTTAFQRVTERAALLTQESDRAVVTGADILLAIFSKTQSPMARPLGEQRSRACGCVIAPELRQGIELDKAPRISPVQGSIPWEAVPSAFSRTETRLLKSMTLLAGVNVQLSSKEPCVLFLFARSERRLPARSRALLARRGSNNLDLVFLWLFRLTITFSHASSLS